MIVDWMERGLLPDPVVRFGVRRLLRDRLRKERAASGPNAIEAMAARMRRGPIAVDVGRANEQHYELPAEFFRRMLGARLKYSAGYWPAGVHDPDSAEEAMLRLTCTRAEIEDGARVLDLGCGWGSLSLWIAERFPSCRVVAVSNSESQREFILGECGKRGFGNLEVVTADMNRFEPRERFDRVVSVEMFEHMRNYGDLLRRIRSWLDPRGKLFVHLFCHRTLAYFFEVDGDRDWMARYFFTGGTMPSEDLLRHFPDDLTVEKHWWINGDHYRKTLLAWLGKLDSNREEATAILREVHGAGEGRRWLERWRIFLIASAELFGYGRGEEWGVAHYLLGPSAGRSR